MNARYGTFAVLSCTLSAPFTYVARLQWLRVLNPLLVLRKPEALPRREAESYPTTPACHHRPATDATRPSLLDGRIACVRKVGMRVVGNLGKGMKHLCGNQRAFAQRDSLVAGNASRSQCDATGVLI